MAKKTRRKAKPTARRPASTSFMVAVPSDLAAFVTTTGKGPHKDVSIAPLMTTETSQANQAHADGRRPWKLSAPTPKRSASSTTAATTICFLADLNSGLQLSPPDGTTHIFPALARMNVAFINGNEGNPPLYMNNQPLGQLIAHAWVQGNTLVLRLTNNDETAPLHGVG